MNERIRELWAQCVIKHTKTPMNWQDVADEFAELIVRELVSTLQAEYCDFYHNEANDWGCITVKYFVPGNAHLMRGEETKAEYVGGVIKGTGRFRLNERFVEYLMKNHFGVEE